MMDRYIAVISLENIPPEEIDDRLAQLTAGRWELAEAPRPRSGLRLLCGDFADDAEALNAAPELQRVMGEQWVPDTAVACEAKSALPVGRYVLNIAPSDKLLDVGTQLGKAGLAPVAVDIEEAPQAVVAEKPAETPPATAAKTEGSTTGEEAAATVVASPSPVAAARPPAAPAPAPPSGDVVTPELVQQGLAALAAPPSLWGHVDEAARGELASGIVERLYKDRATYADRVQWLVAPELALLERAPEADQASLAKLLLESRAGVAAYQLERAKLLNEQLAQEIEFAKRKVKRQDQQVLIDAQTVKRHEEQVKLDGKRVELAGHAVSLAAEVNAQLGKWRKIADWGVGLLLGTVLMATIATGFVLYLVAESKIDDWVAPLLIFVLALFAVSPAVLLLRERPLEGIDKWMPGEKPASDEPAAGAKQETAGSGETGPETPAAAGAKSDGEAKAKTKAGSTAG